MDEETPLDPEVKVKVEGSSITATDGYQGGY
jgi:hypothetical protein